MPHWQNIHIEQFRRVRNLHLEGLGRVNLLVGKNNSGKTTVLEALAILCHPANPWNWFDIARRREVNYFIPITESLESFFPRALRSVADGLFSGQAAAKTQGVAGNGEFKAFLETFRYAKIPLLFNKPSEEPQIATRLTINAPSLTEPCVFEFFPGQNFAPSTAIAPPQWPMQMITTVTHRTDHAVLENTSRAIELGGRKELVTLLATLEPDLEDLEILSRTGHIAAVKIFRRATGFLSLSSEGDGVRRALALVTAAYCAKGGILFIDEIETALHNSALERVFRTLILACQRFDVQVFATTHSLEAVDALFAAMEDRVNDLVLYRLPSAEAQPPRRFDGAQARRIRHEEGFDLR